MGEFTHFDAQGNAVMVDVSRKEPAARRAVAAGRITMSAECYDAVRQGSVKKGDVLGVARIAGIMAVKQTGSIIPLCHNIPIGHAAVDFTFDDQERSVSAACTVKTTGATGAEMEALTGVSAALLTVYDMCKAIDKHMEIGGIHLVEKSGGKSGLFVYGNRA